MSWLASWFKFEKSKETLEARLARLEIEEVEAQKEWARVRAKKNLYQMQLYQKIKLEEKRREDEEIISAIGKDDVKGDKKDENRPLDG